MHMSFACATVWTVDDGMKFYKGMWREARRKKSGPEELEENEASIKGIEKFFIFLYFIIIIRNISFTRTAR